VLKRQCAIFSVYCLSETHRQFRSQQFPETVNWYVLKRQCAIFSVYCFSETHRQFCSQQFPETVNRFVQRMSCVYEIIIIAKHVTSSSIGTTTLSWVSACSTAIEHSQQESFYRVPMPAARQTPNLEENQGFRTFQLSP
jgi:hypothetical protein